MDWFLTTFREHPELAAEMGVGSDDLTIISSFTNVVFIITLAGEIRKAGAQFVSKPIDSIQDPDPE